MRGEGGKLKEVPVEVLSLLYYHCCSPYLTAGV